MSLTDMAPFEQYSAPPPDTPAPPAPKPPNPDDLAALGVSPPPTDFQRSEMEYQPPDVGQMQATAERVPGLEELQQIAAQQPEAIQQSAQFGGWQTPSTPYALGGPQMGPPTGEPLSEPIPSTEGNPFGTDRYENDPILGAFDKLAALPGRASEAVTVPVVNPLTDPLINLLPDRAKVGALAARQAAEQMPGYIAADVLTGGAAQPAITASMMKQAADAGSAYANGDMSGKQALSQLALSIGPMALPMVLHATGEVADGLRNFAATDEGQQVIARVRTFATAEGGGGTIGGEPPAEPPAAGALPGAGGPEQPQPVAEGAPQDVAVSRASEGETAPPVGDLAPGANRVTFGTGEERQPPMQGVSENRAPGTPPQTGDPVGALLARAEARNVKGLQSAADQATEEAYVHTIPEHVEQRAVNLGATPEDARLMAKTAQTIALTVSQDEPLLNAPPRSVALAKAVSAVEGQPVGVVGDIALNLRDLGASLGITRNDWIDANLGPIVRAIQNDVPKLTYIGDEAKAAHLEDLSSAGLPGYAITHPDEFSGWSPAGKVAVESLQNHLRSRYALLRAIDPTVAAPVEGNYMMRVYERPNGELMQPIVRPRGEVGVAQERAFKDEWQAYGAGMRFKQMPLDQLIRTAMQATDQGVQDGFFKREFLQRFGTTDAKAAKANGWQPIRAGVFPSDTSGWYADPQMQNVVARMYEPSAVTRGIPGLNTLSSAGKSLLVFPGDIGGVAVRVLELAATQPHNLAAGILNHLLGDPARVFTDELLPRDVALQSEGISTGAAGSVAQGLKKSPLGYLPGMEGIDQATLAKAMHKLNEVTWSTTLGNERGLAYEGNLALRRLIGQDISLDTPEGLANRAAARDLINAFSGASRGAATTARRQLENVALLSSQNTRALAAQFGQAAKLLSPSASLGTRLSVAATIAAAGSTIWGMGALSQMAGGSGQVIPFPVTWKNGKFVYNSQWGNVNIAGMTVPILRQQTFINALAQSFTILANEGKSGDVQDAIKSGDFSGLAPKLGDVIAPEAKVALGRAGVLPRAGAAALGYGYDPSTGATLGDLNPTQRLIQAVPLPIPASKAIENPSSSPGAFAAEQVLGAYPESAYTQVTDARDSAAKAAGFKDFADLQTNGTRAQVDQVLADPTVQKAQQDYQQSNVGKNPKVDALRADQKADDDALAAGTMTPQNWRTAMTERGKQIALLQAGRPDFQTGDPTLDGYYALFKDPTLVNQTTGQTLDPGALSEAIDGYRAGLSPAELNKLDNSTGLGLNTSPAMQQYRDDVKAIAASGYFDVGTRVWAKLQTEGIAPQGYASAAEFEAALGQRVQQRLEANASFQQLLQSDPDRAALVRASIVSEVQSSLPFIGTYDKVVGDVKNAIAGSDLHVGALLNKWYGKNANTILKAAAGATP